MKDGMASVALPGGHVASIRAVSTAAAPGAAELGVRPEHLLAVAPEDAAVALPGKVSIVEHLGNSTILYVETPAGQLVVEGKGNLVAKPGDSSG